MAATLLFLDVSSWGSAPAGTEDASSSQAPKTRSASSRLGLNLYLLFRNQKLSARKALIAPDRKLRQSELEELEAEFQSTWAGMSAAERGSWERVYAGWSIAPPKSKPSAGSVAVPVGPAGPVVYSPWCDQGSAEKPIPVQTIADYISETPRKTLTQLSRSDARVDVHTAKPRTSSLEGEPHEQQHGLWGCCASKLACRATVPGPIADSIDNITDMLASWVQSLGAGAAQKCDSLACMRGAHPTTGLRKDVIVLLLMSRQQPSLQFFARCAIAAGVEEPAAADGAEVLPEALPCVVSLRIVQSRLSSHFRAVDICSSEELAQQLATSGTQ